MAAGRFQVVSAVSYCPAWHAPRRAYREHEVTKIGQNRLIIRAGRGQYHLGPTAVPRSTLKPDC